MGTILYNSSRGRNDSLSWIELMLFVILANFADTDYIPGYFIGNPNLFHHGMTHSFVFGIIVSSIVGLLYYAIKRESFFKMSIFMFLTYSSHLIMDYFGKDTRFPFGEQLFWPISDEYFLSSFYIFNDVHKASSSDIFFQSLFSWHNLATIIQEILILTPILILIEYIRKTKRRSS